MNVYLIIYLKNTQQLSLGSCDIFPKELNQIFNKTMPKKMTKEEFIAKAEARYGKGKYNYDEVDYQGNKIKVKIHCNICGEDFWKRPNDFLSGSECYCQHEHLTPRNYTVDNFIEKAIEIYGPDKYKFDKVNYINNVTLIEIFCCSCQEYFWRTPMHFLKGSGCNCQSGVTTEKYIQKALSVYGPDVFDYSITNYKGCSVPIQVIDKKSGIRFWTNPKYHLEGHGSPIRNESGGEFLVRSILNEFNINFKKEFSVINKINGRNQKYIKIDFQLNLNNKEIWIEYNGIQHYKYINNFFKETIDDYQKQLTRDKNVRDYCKEHDILLIEIPYTYTKYEILKPILEDILFNGKLPEDIIIYPEIEMYTKFFKT